MVYEDFKDLLRRTTFDKGLRNKALAIASNPQCDGYNVDWHQCSISSLIRRLHRQ